MLWLDAAGKVCVLVLKEINLVQSLTVEKREREDSKSVFFLFV